MIMRLLNLSLAIAFSLLGAWALLVAFRDNRTDLGLIGTMSAAMAFVLTFIDKNEDGDDY